MGGSFGDSIVARKSPGKSCDVLEAGTTDDPGAYGGQGVPVLGAVLVGKKGAMSRAQLRALFFCDFSEMTHIPCNERTSLEPIQQVGSIPAYEPEP